MREGEQGLKGGEEHHDQTCLAVGNSSMGENHSDMGVY